MGKSLRGSDTLTVRRFGQRPWKVHGLLHISTNPYAQPQRSYEAVRSNPTRLAEILTGGWCVHDAQNIRRENEGIKGRFFRYGG